MAQHMLKIRQQITLNWSGTEPLALPSGRTLQPGDTTLPMELWHSIGGDPVINDHITHGWLKPVHRTHEFQDGDEHCIGCSMTRLQAEAERAARQPRKTAPVAAGEKP
jgi:hypothetical protein